MRRGTSTRDEFVTRMKRHSAKWYALQDIFAEDSSYMTLAVDRLFKVALLIHSNRKCVNVIGQRDIFRRTINRAAVFVSIRSIEMLLRRKTVFSYLAVNLCRGNKPRNTSPGSGSGIFRSRTVFNREKDLPELFPFTCARRVYLLKSHHRHEPPFIEPIIFSLFLCRSPTARKKRSATISPFSLSLLFFFPRSRFQVANH